MANKWRTGRSLHRTLYLMVSDEPSKEDHFVGIMDDSDLAEAVVRTMNNREAPPAGDSLTDELRMVLNRHSAENVSNTPDSILAEYLLAALDAFNWATRERDKWYGIHPKPGWGGADPL